MGWDRVGESRTAELLVWSGTTRIVAAHQRARTTRELSLLLSLSRQPFFSTAAQRTPAVF